AKSFEAIIRYWDDWIIPTQPSVFFKREICAEFGEFDPEMHMAMDYEFWLRVTQKYPMAHLPQVLSVYRFHQASKSGTSGDWSHFFKEWYKAWIRHRGASRLLPEPSMPLLSIAIPVLRAQIFDRPSAVQELEKTLSAIFSNIILDVEILLISDLKQTLRFEKKDSPIQIRTLQSDSALNLDSFLEIAIQNAQGFAIHFPTPGDMIPQRGYVRPLDSLLDHPTLDVAEIKQGLSIGQHPLLPADLPVGPSLLSRTEPLRRALRSEPSSAGAPEAPLLFSVIIPTFNRSDILKSCLEHLSQQTMEPSRFEVLICDDGSTDDTARVVQSLSMPYKFRHLPGENRGPAAARNRGIREARGEYLLILNDDALLEPQVLQLHLDEHRKRNDPKAAVLGKFQMHPNYVSPETPIGYCMEHSDLIFDYFKMKPNEPYGYNMFYTCNISLRRNFVLEGSLFDEGFYRLAGAEDIEYGYRLEQRGCHVWYRPDCIAWHAHKIDTQGLVRMFEVRGKGGVVLFLKQNHLPHHTDHLGIADVERFQRNRQQGQRLCESIFAMVNQIDTHSFRAVSPKPLLMDGFAQFWNTMFLWKLDDQGHQGLLEKLLEDATALEQQLANPGIYALEETAQALFPILHTIKWYADTCGVMDSSQLPELMRLDQQVRTGAKRDQTEAPLIAPKRPRIAPPEKAYHIRSPLQEHNPFRPGSFFSNRANHQQAYEHFRLRMLDGNLALFRNLEYISPLLHDLKTGSPALLSVVGYGLLRMLEEAPYLEDINALARQLLASQNHSDTRLDRCSSYLSRYKAFSKAKTKAAELYASYDYSDALATWQGLNGQISGDPEIFSRLHAIFLEQNADYRSFAAENLPLFHGSPFEAWSHYVIGRDFYRIGNIEEAAPYLQKSLALEENCFTINLLGQCYLLAGQEESAMSYWRESLKRDPLQTHLYLKMYSVQQGFHHIAFPELDTASVAILIYSWNKREILKKTLEELRTTLLGQSTILILDNGSTDGTPEMLKNVISWFPGRTVRILSLPTNIGAPAARNWLMAQPEAKAAKYIAYLDDDVSLPQ
ncbi:MAG TPA: glycosyltransferase, partial [Fibrobacteraceae bacterium]|nr:glycosyltransferase [Fibrobacteraceae bacterium]